MYACNYAACAPVVPFDNHSTDAEGGHHEPTEHGSERAFHDSIMEHCAQASIFRPKRRPTLVAIRAERLLGSVPMVGTQQRLGALLVEMGFIDDAQLESALEEQQRTEKRLGKILVEASVLSEDRLVHALSRQLGIEACDPIMTRVHERVLALIPSAVAFKHRVLPVARQREADQRDVVYVATADPLDQDAHRVVSEILGDEARVQWMLAGETEMELALARHYGQMSLPEGTKVITGVPIAGPPRSPELADGPRLASTDDMFLALNDAPADAATTQPDQPLASLAPSAAGRAGPAEPADALPLSALSASSTEEILIADDIVSVEDGAIALADLNGSGAEPVEEAFESQTLVGTSFDALTGPESLRTLSPTNERMPDPVRLESVPLDPGILSPSASAQAGRPASASADRSASASADRSASASADRSASASADHFASAQAGHLASAQADRSAPVRAEHPASVVPDHPSVSPVPLLDVVEPPELRAPVLEPASAIHAMAPEGPPFVESRSDDITDELLRGRPADLASLDLPAATTDKSPTPAVDVSWGDLLTSGSGPALPENGTTIDADAFDPPLPGVHVEALAALTLAAEQLPLAAEQLPLAESSLAGERPTVADVDIEVAVDEVLDDGHPASPFPPLEGQPEIEEPEDAPQIDLNELVSRLTKPDQPLTRLPLPTEPQETAQALHQELQFFADGGTVDLSSQQRILRAVTAVLMKEGLLSPDRLESLLRAQSLPATAPSDD